MMLLYRRALQCIEADFGTSGLVGEGRRRVKFAKDAVKAEVSELLDCCDRWDAVGRTRWPDSWPRDESSSTSSHTPRITEHEFPGLSPSSLSPGHAVRPDYREIEKSPTPPPIACRIVDSVRKVAEKCMADDRAETQILAHSPSGNREQWPPIAGLTTLQPATPILMYEDVIQTHWTDRPMDSGGVLHGATHTREGMGGVASAVQNNSVGMEMEMEVDTHTTSGEVPRTSRGMGYM